MINTIRKALKEDLEVIMPMYEQARVRMRKSGNLTQWVNGYPSEQLIRGDIERGNFFIVENGKEILGAFSMIIGEEPTYKEIDGNWLNEEPYGTIHRLLSSFKTKGIGEQCINYCLSLIPNIRIDTHADNHAMQAVIRRCGFRFCGIIRVADGTPRLAFQKSLNY